MRKRRFFALSGHKTRPIADNNDSGAAPDLRFAAPRSCDFPARAFFCTAAEKTEGNMKKQTFLKGAAVIAAGGFIAKLIGALYRIPLTNLIGAEGMGMYQLVYPFYCLLLTVSATGIPSSIAKLAAERRASGRSDLPVLKSALILFLGIGGVGTLLMMALSPLLSGAQGSPELKSGYLALAPSVLLVSGISVFRGWFQGRNNMFPTAFSEVLEQIVKVGLSLLLAYVYRSDVRRAVTLILLSVSVSEAAALLLMLLLYRRARNRSEVLNEGGRVSMKSVLRLSIPVTLSAALLPFSALLDSVIVVRLLKGYTDQAVTLYGLFSGGAVTIVNLPVSICYGIAAASVPAVSAAGATERAGTDLSLAETGKKGRSARSRVVYALLVTLAASIPCALGLYFFARPAVRIIFRALAPSESEVLVRLVRVFAVSAVTLSCTQTLSACLTGLGKPKYAAFSMGIAVLVKTALNFALVSRPEISVYGAAIAADVCYLVAFALDLVYNLSVTRSGKKDGNRRGQETGKGERAHDYGGRIGCERGRSYGKRQTGNPVCKAGGRADGTDGIV